METRPARPVIYIKHQFTSVKDICNGSKHWNPIPLLNSSSASIRIKKDFIKSFSFCLFSCPGMFWINEIWIRDQCTYTGTYLSSGYSWLWRPTLHGDWCSLCLDHWLSSLSDRSQSLQIKTFSTVIAANAKKKVNHYKHKHSLLLFNNLLFYIKSWAPLCCYNFIYSSSKLSEKLLRMILCGC